MVTKTDLEEKHLNMQRLEGRVNILMLQNDSKLRQHENQYQENLQDSTQRYQLKLEEQKNKFQALRDEKADMMVDFQEKEKQFLKWSKQRCEKLDMMNQSTLRDQIKNYQDTESAYQESKHKFKKDLKNMEDRHTEAMADSQRLHEERHRKAVERVEKAREDKDNIIRQFNETTRQLELDTDLEIERLKTKYESMLAVEKEAKMRLKGENGIMKKRFSSLEKQIVDQNEEIKEIEETSELLEDKVSDLQTEITRLKKRIKKMDQTISERETQIYDLKKNIGELEKHKFVLDYSIKQQNLQIEPREKEISNMKNDVLRLDGDLERLHKENGELTDEIQHLKKKMGEKQRTDKFKRQKLNRIKNDLEALKKGIRIVVELIQHPNKLRAGVQRLCKSYMKITETQEKVASTVQGEYDKQKEHLKKTVKVLKKKLRLESEARRKNVVAVLKENMMLLNEIKELRENLKKLKQMVYDEEPLNNDSYSYTDPEAEKIVQLQRDQIESLRKEIDLVTERLGLDSGGAISKQRAQVV